MKRLITLFLVAAVTMFFYSCSENNSTAPELSQSDQVTSTLAKVKTPFTGSSNHVADIGLDSWTTLPNGKTKILGMASEWVEATDCDLVNGQSFWNVNWLINSDWTRAKLWGKADINVGVEEVGDPVLGTWELSWQGKLTEGVLDPDIGFFVGGKIVVKAIGKGKSGIVKGMVGHWTYTMNIAEGFVYMSEGFIANIR